MNRWPAGVREEVARRFRRARRPSQSSGGQRRGPTRPVVQAASCIGAILLLALQAWGGSAETPREPDIVVTAERVGKWEMSFEDMEFVTHVITCGKRLYWDGQKRAAWPYIHMGARYGDIDSQFIAANMLGVGKDVPRNWDAAVGWLGVASEGNVKPMAQKRLRDTREALCGGRTDCERRFDGIVADYRSRYGRRATGMACRRIKGEQGSGVLSLRVNRGSRAVACRFARLLHLRGVLADAELEAAIGTAMSEPDQIGTVRPELATVHPGRLEFSVRTPDGPVNRIRCPDLGGVE